MRLKKFNQFLKNINEDQTTPEVDPIENYDTPDAFRDELGDEELGEDDFADDMDEEDVVNNPDEFDESEEDFSEEEAEEEGQEYEGTKLMQELASKLGTEVVDNQIDYEGKTINYYSETEKFHIGRDKFDTIDEVIDFLGAGSGSEEIEADEEYPDTRGELEGIGESRRYIKRFN